MFQKRSMGSGLLPVRCFLLVFCLTFYELRLVDIFMVYLILSNLTPLLLGEILFFLFLYSYFDVKH